MDALAASVRPWADLPHEILTNILHRVDQGPRLGHCARVCRSWAEAAAAVTRSVVLNCHFASHSQALRGWFAAHGSQVTELRIRTSDCPLDWLPGAQHLEHLRLGPSYDDPLGYPPGHVELLYVNLDVSSKLCADLASAATLTSVVLDSVRVEEEDVSVLFDALAALPRLERLALVCLQLYDADNPTAFDDDEWHAVYLPEDCLERLPHLTHLRLSTYVNYGSDVLCGLTALTALQRLDLDDFYAADWYEFPEIVQQGLKRLTSLHMEDCCSELTWPQVGASHLTALQDLTVCGDLEAAELQGLQQLQGLTRLQLAGLLGSLTPSTAPGFTCLSALQHLDLGSRFGAQALFNVGVLAGSKQLTQVDLQGFRLQGAPQQPSLQHDTPLTAWLSTANSRHKIAALARPPPSFAPLTASSSLQSLRLVDCLLGRWEDDELPPGKGCWQQMFGPKQLPALTELRLSSVKPEVLAEDLQAVVRCCPALQSLQLVYVLPDGSLGAELAVLTALTALTTLAVSAPDDDACGVLAQLTRLSSLVVHRPQLITARGLWSLTSLQRLTSLGFDGHVAGAEVSWTVEEQMQDILPGCCRAIVAKPPSTLQARTAADLLRPPHVWECLYELCSANMQHPRKALECPPRCQLPLLLVARHLVCMPLRALPD